MTISLGFGTQPAWDRCESIDGTIRTGHYFVNVAAQGERPCWQCANCGDQQ